MKKYRTFLYYLCLIIMLLHSSLATERDTDYSGMFEAERIAQQSHTGANTVTVFIPPADGMSREVESAFRGEINRMFDHKDTELRDYFNPVVLSLRVPNSAKQVLAGLAGVLAAFPAFQVPVPLFLSFLGDVGVTDEMLPSTIAIIVVAPLPVLTGILAAYKGAARILSYEDPDFVKLQQKVTKRERSLREKYAYSFVNKCAHFLFYAFIISANITNMESHVSWKIWPAFAVGFSLLFLIPEFYMYIASTNNPNKHPNRHFSSDEARQRHFRMDAIMKVVKEEIRDGNLYRARELSRHMNILISEAPATETHRLLGNSPESLIPPGTASDEGPEQSNKPAQRGKDEVDERDRSLTDMRLVRNATVQSHEYPYAYLKVLAEMENIYESTPLWKLKWRRGKEVLAQYASYISQTLSLPMRYIGVYGAVYNMVNLVLPAPVAMGAGIISTATLALFIPGGAYKEIPLVQDEFYEFFGLYAADSPPYWAHKYASFLADRLPSVVSMGGGLYITGSVWWYLRHRVLEDLIGIHNIGAQVTLIAPLLIPVYAGARQFVSKYMATTIANWVSTGMEVNIGCKFKIIPCANQGPCKRLENGQNLLEKVTELEDKVCDLNEEYMRAMVQALHRPRSVDPSVLSQRPPTKSLKSDFEP